MSTRTQKDDSQLDALHAADCERIWTDQASGRLARRPEWDDIIARQMYDEKDTDGKRHYTVADIAETFHVSHKTIYRAHLG